MKAIVAMAENRVIGKNNALPWPLIKEDFQWFKEFTNGQKILVGKNTFDGLPNLKNRECYVLVRQDVYIDSYVTLQYCINVNGYDGRMVSMADVDQLDPNTIVIGGAKTYMLLMDKITEMYVTHISGVYDGDTYMLPFEHLFNVQEVIKEFGEHKVIKYSKVLNM